jgi:hypothetical protein
VDSRREEVTGRWSQLRDEEVLYTSSNINRIDKLRKVVRWAGQEARTREMRNIDLGGRIILKWILKK